jgi:hypothetical protein
MKQHPVIFDTVYVAKAIAEITLEEVKLQPTLYKLAILRGLIEEDTDEEDTND